MIFINIKTEPIVQVDDKTRIDVRDCYSPDGTDITTVEVSFDAEVTWIDVTENRYVDYQFGTSGEKTIVARVNETDTKTATLLVVTAAVDNLFSKDSDIVPLESNILEFVQDGRSSFIDKHRMAQIEILNELDAAEIWKADGTRYVASDISDIQEFKEWSKYVTLRIIFEDISNAIDDVYANKATAYQTAAINAKKRATLRLPRETGGENIPRKTSSGKMVFSL